MRWTVALPLLLASCSAPDVPPEAAAASSAVDAEFRFQARDLYDSLLMRSCGSDRNGRRAQLLAPELELVEAFEDRMPVAARNQLQVARADSLHAQTAEQKCESNDDPDSARRHLEAARKDIRTGLGQLEAIAPRLEYSIPPGAASVPKAAEFRHRIRKLLFWHPAPCPLSTLGPNDDVDAGAMAELAAFEQRLAATRYAVHYALAEADSAHERRITMFECAEPSAVDLAKLRRETLEHVRKEIAAIEALVRAAK